MSYGSGAYGGAPYGGPDDAAGGPQTVAVGIIVETETARPVAEITAIIVPVGTVHETETLTALPHPVTWSYRGRPHIPSRHGSPRTGGARRHPQLVHTYGKATVSV